MIAAAILGIKIAHIHGGEVTEGAFDEFMRHSITKMSQIHFVANKKYQKRVIQLGEEPKNVHIVGTGTIGLPLIGLFTRHKKAFDINEVTFHKNTPLKQNSLFSISMFAVGVEIFLPKLFPFITFPDI